MLQARQYHHDHTTNLASPPILVGPLMGFLPCPYPFSPQNCPRCPRPCPTMKSKKKRPKPNNHNAPRIDLSTSTLSLRQQLSLAKAAATESAPAKPIVRTKFRRKKGPPSRDYSTQETDLPDGKYAKAPDPLLYIDGYNVVGCCPRLRKFRDRGDMESARRFLVSDVAEFSNVKGWDCVVVFDAQGTEQVEKTESSVGVTVIYTGAETADTYIERNVYQMCELGHRQIWAATSDVAQLSFSSAKGAHVMSSKLFVQELKRAKKEMREKVAERDCNSVRGKMLISNVDAITRDRLYRLRDGKL